MVLPTLARRMAASTRLPSTLPYRMVLSRGYKTENPLYKDDVRIYATDTTAINSRSGALRQNLSYIRLYPRGHREERPRLLLPDGPLGQHLHMG